MKEEDMSRFRENEACQGCEHLEECREAQAPRRTSCWIRFYRERYWKPTLGEQHSSPPKE